MPTRIKGLDHWAIVTNDENPLRRLLSGRARTESWAASQAHIRRHMVLLGRHPDRACHFRSRLSGRADGAFDHIAFAMEGSHTEMEKKLVACGIEYKSRLIERHRCVPDRLPGSRWLWR